MTGIVQFTIAVQLEVICKLSNVIIAFDLFIVCSKGHGLSHAYMSTVNNLETVTDGKQMILSSNMISCIGFRLAFLHMTLLNFNV